MQQAARERVVRGGRGGIGRVLLPRAAVMLTVSPTCTHAALWCHRMVRCGIAPSLTPHLVHSREQPPPANVGEVEENSQRHDKQQSRHALAWQLGKPHLRRVEGLRRTGAGATEWWSEQTVSRDIKRLRARLRGRVPISRGVRATDGREGRGGRNGMQGTEQEGHRSFSDWASGLRKGASESVSTRGRV